MFFKSLLLATLLATTPLLSQAQTANPYTPDHINFLTPPGNFEELGVTPKELGEWVNSLDSIFSNVFKKDIDEKTTNKVVIVYTGIKGIQKPEHICKKDYTKCVSMSVEIKYTDNISSEQIEKFGKEVEKIKPIKINNPSSQKDAIFVSYTNTLKM